MIKVSNTNDLHYRMLVVYGCEENVCNWFSLRHKFSKGHIQIQSQSKYQIPGIQQGWAHFIRLGDVQIQSWSKYQTRGIQRSWAHEDSNLHVGPANTIISSHLSILSLLNWYWSFWCQLYGFENWNDSLILGFIGFYHNSLGFISQLNRSVKSILKTVKSTLFSLFRACLLTYFKTEQKIWHWVKSAQVDVVSQKKGILQCNRLGYILKGFILYYFVNG